MDHHTVAELNKFLFSLLKKAQKECVVQPGTRLTAIFAAGFHARCGGHAGLLCRRSRLSAHLDLVAFDPR